MSNTSTGLGELAKAMVLAQAEMPPITLDSKVSFKAVNFEYASLPNIIKTTKPILAKYKLCILQFPSGEGKIVKVETMLLHNSGEFITSEISGTLNNVAQRGEEPKFDPKELGSMITYLRRYAYGAVLGLSLDGDYDGELVSEKYYESADQKVWLKGTLHSMGITDVETMRKVSAQMKSKNYEVSEDDVIKAVEAIR